MKSIPLRRRRLQLLSKEGRSVQRAHTRREFARAGGFRIAVAANRSSNQAHHSDVAKARFQVALPAQLRRGTHQSVRFHKSKKGDSRPPMPLAQALTRMAAAAKNFKLESVSNTDLAWVAVGAGTQE